MWVPTTRDDIVELFIDKPLDFAPGTNFNYSNSGYYLLGLIVEAAGGQDYYDYLRAEILDRLQLTDTVNGKYEDIVPGRARGYGSAPDGFSNAAPTPNLTPFAAASLQATAGDIAAFRRATMVGDWLTPKLRARLLELGSFPDGTLQTYALGSLQRGEHLDQPLWGHSGGISDFLSYHGYYPALDLTVVVLTNGQPEVGSGGLARQLVAALLGEAPAADADIEAVSLSKAEINVLVGNTACRRFG